MIDSKRESSGIPEADACCLLVTGPCLHKYCPSMLFESNALFLIRFRCVVHQYVRGYKWFICADLCSSLIVARRCRAITSTVGGLFVVIGRR